MQKATNVIVNARLKRGTTLVNGNKHTEPVPNQPLYHYGSDYSRCFTEYTYGWFNIGQSSSAFSCVEKDRTYTADTGWIKLNNSIQEYRENF